MVSEESLALLMSILGRQGVLGSLIIPKGLLSGSGWSNGLSFMLELRKYMRGVTQPQIS